MLAFFLAIKIPTAKKILQFKSDQPQVQDFDGRDQGPLHSGFSGIMVPVTPVTALSEETIQAATDQQAPWTTRRLITRAKGKTLEDRLA